MDGERVYQELLGRVSSEVDRRGSWLLQFGLAGLELDLPSFFTLILL